MRLLKALLVLTGVVAAVMGILRVVQRQQADPGCQYPCEQGSLVDSALGSAVWFCIAFALWSMALVFAWMERKFDQSPI